MSELISIIVPVYNIEAYLPRCLDSILNQSYQNIEVIAIDDGSTDSGGKVLDKYARLDSRIKVIHKDNAGVTSARMTGIVAAQGIYIGFVDGDDKIESDMYERLYYNIKRTGADISHCGHQVIRENKPIEYLYNTGRFAEQSSEEALKELLAGSYEPGLCNKLYHNTLFHSLLHDRIIDETIKINEDLLMNYYLFRSADKVVFEDFCPYHYIKREGSASRTNNDNHIWDPIKVKDIILSDCIGTNIEPIARATRLNTLLNTYHGLIGSLNKKKKDAVVELIKTSRDDVKYLARKRAIYVKTLLICPNLYDFIRNVYSLFRYE